MKRKKLFSTKLVILLLLVIFPLVFIMPGCQEAELDPSNEQGSNLEPDPSPDQNDKDEKEQGMTLPSTKEVVQVLEGMEEKTVMSLHESKLGYYIYIDQERYQLEELNGVDKIIPRAKAENLPEVLMEITREVDKKPQDMASQIKDELKEKYQVEFHEEVDNPLESIYLYAEGKNSDDTVVRYYLVEDSQEGTLVIKQKLFIEAIEGHGIRFDNMLQELIIADK